MVLLILIVSLILQLSTDDLIGYFLMKLYEKKVFKVVNKKYDQMLEVLFYEKKYTNEKISIFYSSVNKFFNEQDLYLSFLQVFFNIIKGIIITILQIKLISSLDLMRWNEVLFCDIIVWFFYITSGGVLDSTCSHPLEFKFFDENEDSDEILKFDKTNTNIIYLWYTFMLLTSKIKILKHYDEKNALFLGIEKIYIKVKNNNLKDINEQDLINLKFHLIELNHTLNEN